MNDNILTKVQVIKRHNAAGILIAIFGILTIIVPVMYLVFPWYRVSITDPGSIGLATGAYQITIIDLVKAVFRMPNSTDVMINNAAVTASIRTSQLPLYLTVENIYASVAWFGLSLLFALIIFIQSIVFLIRGKLNHPAGLIVMEFLFFLCNGFFLLDAYRLGAYLNYSGLRAAQLMEVEPPVIKGAFIPTIAIAGSSLLIFLIVWFIYLGGLRKRYYDEDIIFVDIDPKPFEKNDGVLRNTLPNSVTAIGGHEYSKNTMLEIAHIPNGIKELGIGAFSNCIRLKVVTIPTSVKRIGANCFFNCGKLQRLNYAGSKEQWRYISRGSNWLEKAGTTTVLCKDGPISVNPKH